MKKMPPKSADQPTMSHKHCDMPEMNNMDMPDMPSMTDHNEHCDMPDMPMMHHGHGSMATDLRRRLIVVLILMVPLLILTPIMGGSTLLSGILPNYFSAPLVLAIGSAIFFYGGWPFLKGAASELRQKRPAMMLLISMGISVAYFYSAWAVIYSLMSGKAQSGMSFWFELSSLIAIMLLGHLVEMKAVSSAGEALTSLAKLLPKKAHKLATDAKLLSQTEDVEIAELRPGDILLVRENEKIPADGRLLSDDNSVRQSAEQTLALVDESVVTGESRPVAKIVGATVFAGSRNQNRPFKMVVTNTGDHSYLNQVAQLVAEAAQQKSRSEALADRAAGWLFWFALIFAAFSFAFWSFYVGVSAAFVAAAATLVVACPHALGLAVPLVSARLTKIAARHGLLIRNKTALESASHLRYALLDKTGTLTDGQFAVREVVDFPVGNKKTSSARDKKSQILPLIASLETGSTHPLAGSIIEFYRDSFKGKNDKNPQKLFAAEQKKFIASQVEALPGVGLSGVIAKEKYLVASVDFVRERKLKLTKTEAARIRQCQDDGLTLSFLLREKIAKTKTGAKTRRRKNSKPVYETLGFIALGDRIKNTAEQAIKELRAAKLESVMVTGDSAEVAQEVAQKLGIDLVRANLKPGDKSRVVREFQREGRVLFVGDGVNDAPALAAADLSCAIGAGTDVAADSADVVLTNSDPADIAKLLRLAKRSNRKIRQNLWWGAGYNLLAVPLAVFGILNPILAGVFMSASTVIVALNASSFRDI